jgi:hypothetical protein
VARGFVVGGPWRVEVRALVEEGADIPGANRAFFLAADKSGPAGAGVKGNGQKCIIKL